MDLAAFDTAHVQHIVDKAQQMVAGRKDLGQTILYLIPVFNVGRSQRCKANDSVHGRADVVGHIGQEDTLGPVGALSGVHSLLQR